MSAFFFASIATTIHCDPNFFELSKTTSGFWTAAVFIETLSAPALNTEDISSKDLKPPPIVNGINTSFAVFEINSWRLFLP